MIGQPVPDWLCCTSKHKVNTSEVDKWSTALLASEILHLEIVLDSSTCAFVQLNAAAITMTEKPWQDSSDCALFECKPMVWIQPWPDITWSTKLREICQDFVLQCRQGCDISSQLPSGSSQISAISSSYKRNDIQSVLCDARYRWHPLTGSQLFWCCAVLWRDIETWHGE